MKPKRPIAGIADSVRRLRKGGGFSLDELAKLSGVSKSMISKVERGEASPTTNILGRLAEALDVSISQLMGVQDSREVITIKAADQPVFSSDRAGFARRCLSPLFPAKGIDFVLNTLAEGARSEPFVAHRYGVEEHLYVSSGRVRVHLGAESHDLEEGDALFFQAHVEHEFENIGPGEAAFYIVIDSSKLRG
jgi:transcriptional regulator with XRE-family HTH domain